MESKKHAKKCFKISQKSKMNSGIKETINEQLRKDKKDITKGISEQYFEDLINFIIIEIGLMKCRDVCVNCGMDMNVNNYHIPLCIKCREELLNKHLKMIK